MDDGHITPGMAAGSRSRNGAIYRGFNLCLVHSAHYKRGDTMNRTWTKEAILAAVERMKEQFFQNADYLFCNPADYEELNNLVGDRLNVRSNAGIDPGKIYLVDRSATVGWRWFSEFEEPAPIRNEKGEKNEDPLQMPEI